MGYTIFCCYLLSSLFIVLISKSSIIKGDLPYGKSPCFAVTILIFLSRLSFLLHPLSALLRLLSSDTDQEPLPALSQS